MRPCPRHRPALDFHSVSRPPANQALPQRHDLGPTTAAWTMQQLAGGGQRQSAYTTRLQVAFISNQSTYPALTPAKQAGTRCTNPKGMEG